MQATILTPSQQATYDSFRARFNDVIYFDRLVAEAVRKAIIDIETGAVALNSTTTKAFTNKYISARKLPTKEEKALSVEINHIMCTLCVYMIRRSRPPVDIYTPAKITELKNILEGLADYDDIECNLLLTFRDVVETAVKLFPNKDNKARVLFIGHRLGGSNLNMGKYSTGGGQSRPTERRVRIYEYESGTTPHRPSQEMFISKPVPNVIVPKSPPRLTMNTNTNANALNASLGKRVREVREVIEIVAPTSDAPEDLMKQFQNLKQLAADYNDRLGRFVKQKGVFPWQRSDSATTYKHTAAGKSPRPAFAFATNGTTNSNTKAVPIISNTNLAVSFVNQYRSGPNAALHVPIVTPETSEIFASGEGNPAPETQDESLAFTAYDPYVVPMDFPKFPGSTEAPSSEGGLGFLLAACSVVQPQNIASGRD